MKLILLISLFSICFSNLLLASHELGSARLSNINLSSNNTVFIQDNKYPIIATHPTISSWGFYDASFKNRIILGIDRYNSISISDFVATVTVQITSALPQALGSSPSVITKTLSVSYEGKNDHQSALPHNSINEDVYSFINGYAVLTKITGVSVSIAGAPPTSIMPVNVYLQLETDAERFYPLIQNSSPFTNANDVTIHYIPSSDEFEISWSRINGAEQYDLEWLWLDAEKNTFWFNNPDIDFRNNSTRVRTSQQSYRVSNVFEKGQVFFRIRGVGRAGLTFDKDGYTPWSWQDLTTISGGAINTSTVLSVSSSPNFGNDYLFYITLDGLTQIATSSFNSQIPSIHESNKNWQYKATYAEEGKKKEVISYFDGTLRSRQSVTKNNSDNNAIVGETYYDYNGRAVVQALPVPVLDSKIKFYQYSVVPSSGGISRLGFNFELNTNTPYNKEFFDVDNIANTCGVTAKGMHNDNGSANYYSNGSSFINQFAQGYVPDAEHFPFSQTEFTNDNTGRISKQGGVGKTHQIGLTGTNNHETRYLYGTPVQEELDRLFGSEVGYDKHYKKNMVIDANGQVSISYLDQSGRTIATALSGQGPNNLASLKDAAGNVLYSAPTATNVVDADLLNKANANDFDTNTDNNDRVGDELIFSKKILVPTAGTYTISYDLKGTSYTYSCLPTNACYDCVYDLEIDIYDNCLNNPAGFTKIKRTLGNIIPPSSANGNATVDFTLDAICGGTVNFSTSDLSFSGNDLLVNLQQGDYTITKTLKINNDALTYYLNDYLASDCVKELSDFINPNGPDTSGCSLTCDECLVALGNQADYITSGKGSAEEWLSEYQTCKAPCEYESICEVEYITMLADVSPGGQYGDWENGNGDCDPSLYNLSVYNEGNVLPKVKKINSAQSGFEATPSPNWRNPYYRVSNSSSSPFVNEYRDDNGNPAVVYVTKHVVGSVTSYSPPVSSISNLVPVAGSTSQFTIKPEQLQNVSDFIANWQNSWAKSLVFYHPEYAYYDWCLKNSTQKLTSPYQVSIGTGTNVSSNYISSSDDYDSLLLVTDDIVGLSLTDLSSLCNPLTKDPYWDATNGNGYYYNNTNHSTFAIGNRIDQKNISTPLNFPWNYRFKSATQRFNNYQGTAASLPVFAALITTSCSIQYGQSLSAQLGCLQTSYGITSLMTADQIIAQLPTPVLQNKYWDNFRMMYLALKQEMQQEAAESYAMNGNYRGCNDGIGDPSFDPMAMGVPFTHYYIFGPTFGFPGGGYLTQFFDQWFFPFQTPNESQYCNVFVGNLYHTKIKRFPNAKNATDLSNNLSAGDPGASIYASTGLCPNAFYFQNLINTLATSNQLASSTINLSGIPEFNDDLYKVLSNGVIPVNYDQANWTNTINSATSISANMQVGSNAPCILTLDMPATYTVGVFDPNTGQTNVITHTSPFTFVNTGTTPSSTYAFLRLYHLIPSTGSGFTINADIAINSGGSTTFTTITLSGTTCIPLTGCSFTPPCEPTTAAIAMQKLLNAVAATGNMCSASALNPILMNDQSLQPYFLNSFGPLLGAGNWQWEMVPLSSPPSFVIKDGLGLSVNQIVISLGTVPCSSSPSAAFSFANITGNNSAVNNFNINISTVPSSGTSAVTTASTTGSVLLNGNPLQMGICGFDNAKCATVPHQTREEMEAFLLRNITPSLLQASSSNLTSNFNFGFNIRSQLADNYQTYNASQNTNPLYYFWNKNTSASTSTLLTGSFFATTLTPVPAPATPTNACEFTLAFANPTLAISQGHDINSGSYTLSNFTLATGPMVNLSVYDFSITATFGSTSYTLLGTSSCFGMRPCSECSSSSNTSGGYVGTSVINSFPCISAPSYTIGGNAVYTPLSNCQSQTPRINNLNHTIGTSVEFNGQPSQIWNAYNSGTPGDNGTSFFIWHAIETEFAYKQNYTPVNSCPSNKIKFKVHKKDLNGTSFSSTDFTVRINGVVLPFSFMTNLNAEWDEFFYQAFSTTAGVPFLFQISDFSLATNDYFAIDDIVLIPQECFPPSLPCVNNETFEPFPEIEYEDPCVQYALDMIDNEAQELYNVYIDSVKTAFVQGYIKKCMGEAIENLYEKYNVGDYHYTLYYYDQAGNLVRTVPPEGVHIETNATNLASIKTDRTSNLAYGVKNYYTSHNLQTTYTYNSLNQLVKQETPDAGISYFWYDYLGRLVASQNAKQRANSNSNDNYYSYTHYDYLGRIAEVGEMNVPYDFVAMTAPAIAPLINPTNYPDNMAVAKTEVTRTYYGDDDNFTPLIAGSNFTSGSQEYLRSRVTSVTIEDLDDNNSLTYNHGTHYSYDVHGNVKELVQENQALTFANHQFKKVNYNYDLISGKVNQVAYQPNAPDMFLHKYEYDADNRITNVFTSKNGVIWEQDAKYFYYLHGPLARVELGHDKVQATDYAYTLQGWIKGTNSNVLNPSNDIGKDGFGLLAFNTTGNNYLNKYIGRDVSAYSLTYFNNATNQDYLPINNTYGTINSFVAKEPTAGTTPDLFNGNIRQMVVAALDGKAPSKSYLPGAALKNYSYDQLNRIASADDNTSLTASTNEWQVASTGKFNESFTYDQNGNILNAQRNGNQVANLAMDNLTYHYLPNTNKLEYVTDGVLADPYSEDISNQLAGNYSYDPIGNLVADVSEEIANIEWTVYGKIKKITRASGSGKPNMIFNYDASGNRISKTNFSGPFPTNRSRTTYYVRDAQGNVMATYEEGPNNLDIPQYSLAEQHIYGSSRLGLVSNSINLTNYAGAPINISSVKRALGYKSYEISNHLGNVGMVISDRKIAEDNGTYNSSGVLTSAALDGVIDHFITDINSATDYYSFGSPTPNRHYSNSITYRYGFNGKENDNETIGTGEGTQDFGARIYNPALGRFLSLDPKGAANPGLSPYSFAANNPIMLVDVKGENPGLPLLFAIGAVANFVTQVSVHYALNGGDLGAALKKVDYFDVLMTGFETMIGGTAGLSNGLENTFAKLATVEFAKATMDLSFDAPPRRDSNGGSKDGNKTTANNSTFSNFNIKIAGVSKDGKEVMIEIASAKIFGIVNKYLSGEGSDFVKNADLDMKQAIKLNNTSPTDLAPSIKVNGVVQSVDFTAAYEAGTKVISEMGNEKLKGAAVDATAPSGTPTLEKPIRQLNVSDKTKVNIRR